MVTFITRIFCSHLNFSYIFHFETNNVVSLLTDRSICAQISEFLQGGSQHRARRIQRLRQDIQELESQRTELEEDVRQGAAEKQLAHEQRLQLQAEDSQLLEEEERAKLENLELRTKLRNARDETRRLEDEVRRAEEDIRLSELQTQHAEHLVSHLTGQVALVSQVTTHLEQYERRLNELKDSLVADMKAKEEEKAQLTEDKGDSQQMLLLAQARGRDLEEEKTVLAQTLASLETDGRQLSARMQQVVDEKNSLLEEIEALARENERLKQELNRKGSVVIFCE